MREQAPRPAQEWLFVAPDTGCIGRIAAVGVGADICRIGNQVEYFDKKPLKLPAFDVIVIREDSIIKEYADECHRLPDQAIEG